MKFGGNIAHTSRITKNETPLRRESNDNVMKPQLKNKANTNKKKTGKNKPGKVKQKQNQEKSKNRTKTTTRVPPIDHHRKGKKATSPASQNLRVGFIHTNPEKYHQQRKQYLVLLTLLSFLVHLAPENIFDVGLSLIHI